MENILEFGVKRKNEERRDGGCAVIFDPASQKFVVYENMKNGFLGLYGGGFDNGEDEQEGVFREVLEESGLYDFSHIEKIDTVMAHYYNSNKNVNRVAHATCFLAILNSADRKQTKLESHEKYAIKFVSAEAILDNWHLHNENKDRDHWIYFLKRAKEQLNNLGYIKHEIA